MKFHHCYIKWYVTIHPDHAVSCYSVLVSFYARVTRLILLLTVFNYFFLFTFPQKKKRESYYCQSQVKLKCSSVLWGFFRFSIWFICTQCISSRVFYACALCVSRTINPARITNVHFIDFWSFPQREQDKERKTERRMEDMRIRSRSHSFGSTSQLYIISPFTHINT